jgi:alpha-galactosidase
MKEKYVLIGAGSAMFTRGMVADIIRRGQAVELALVDTDSHALVVAKGMAEKMIAAKKAAITLTASTERRDVLPGATAVICTIGVGGRRAWEKDVLIPRKYGIYQPVGDSVMPGGTSRALRMIPAMVAIAKDVLALAPEALFFNYGNPMAPVCRAVRKATGANLVGLCHGVHHVGQFLAEVLGVDQARLSYRAVGMNHFTWFTQVEVDGQDARPRLREIAEQKLARGLTVTKLGAHFAEAGEVGEGEEDLSPFSWQLLLLFGGYPACRDRHVMEFFPHLFAGKGSYYGKTPGVDAYSFEATIANGDRVYQEMERLATARGPLPKGYFRHFGGEHEQVIEIIENLRAGMPKLYSANLPNTGQVPNLPAEAIVESPAVTTASGLHPLVQPPLSSGLAGALLTRFAWVEMAVEAALEGSRGKFIQALLLDGAVTSVEMATKLADELLAAHRQYLPQFA